MRRGVPQGPSRLFAVEIIFVLNLVSWAWWRIYQLPFRIVKACIINGFYAFYDDICRQALAQAGACSSWRCTAACLPPASCWPFHACAAGASLKRLSLPEETRPRHIPSSLSALLTPLFEPIAVRTPPAAGRSHFS